jgi:hypothetical protein
MPIDVALLVGVAPGDGICVLVAAEECWTAAISVEVGEGVAVRVALGEGVGVDVMVTVGGGVSVSVSSNATRPLIVFPFAC